MNSKTKISIIFILFLLILFSVESINKMPENTPPRLKPLSNLTSFFSGESISTLDFDSNFQCKADNIRQVPQSENYEILYLFEDATFETFLNRINFKDTNFRFITFQNQISPASFNVAPFEFFSNNFELDLNSDGYCCGELNQKSQIKAGVPVLVFSDKDYEICKNPSSEQMLNSSVRIENKGWHLIHIANKDSFLSDNLEIESVWTFPLNNLNDATLVYQKDAYQELNLENQLYWIHAIEKKDTIIQSQTNSDSESEDNSDPQENTPQTYSDESPEFNESYSIYNTTNQAEGFEFIDGDSEFFKEKPLSVVAVERENVKVLVPEGYETLAKAHIEDLIRCEQTLGNFFGGQINFPLDKIVSKIYISNDDSNRGSSLSGTIIYRRSQENIDFDLQDVITNNPDGFLYDSSPDYCANSHELTHAFFGKAPFPSWANEGLAQFTQYHNQGDIFHGIECKEDGYHKDNQWYEYSDMSGDNVLDYNTSMCYTQEVVNTFGWDNFYKMLNRLNKFQTGELLMNKNADYHFIKDVLEYVYGDRIYEILRKYGITEEEYDY